MTSLTGVGALARLSLRRDRIMLVAWLYALAAVAYASAAATRKLYPTEGSRAAFAAAAGADRVTVAMYGPSHDLSTLGGLATWKLTAWGAVLFAVMGMVIVIRHTRGDEDAGRLELIGAGAVGRLAALASGLLVALIASLLVGLLVAAGLVIGGVPVIASLAFGLGLAGAGAVFAAIAGVAAQLAASARTATGITAAVLGLAYLLRAAGDTAAAGSWAASLSWVSPIGWMEQVRPFGPVHWWLLLVALAFAVPLAALACLLAARRDLGAGLLPARPGPPVAAPSLRSPLALAWRLQRGPLLAWVAAFLLGGAVTGSLASGIGTLVGSSKAARDMFFRLGGQAGLTDAYLASVMAIFGILASVYATSAALRLRGEETGLRAEPVLAGPVGRLRWAASHLVFALAGPVVLLAAGGLAAGLSYGAGTADPGAALARVMGSALVQAPAAWLLAAVAAVLFGAAPRAAMAVWAVLVAFLFLGEFGSLLGLSQWAIDISPFAQVPRLPAAAFTAVPLIWLAGAAMVLTAAGLAALRQRDLA